MEEERIVIDLVDEVDVSLDEQRYDGVAAAREDALPRTAPASPTRRSPSARHRNWVFTVNNYELLLDPSTWEHCTYCIYQEEVGENGTPHLQGYIEFDTTMSMAACKWLEGLDTAHLEPRLGTQQQAITYCSKADTRVGGPYVYGDPKEPGKRNDLLEVKKLLDEGGSMEQVREQHFASWCRNNRSFKEYKALKVEKRSWPMEIVVIIGPTGTGKTRQAFEMGGDDVYWVMPSSTWWDGYEGQHTVIFDEFYGASQRYSTLLRLLDRYPLRIETKGSSIEFTSRRIIFTSNQDPEDWYASESTHRMPWRESPLFRRISEFGRIIRTGEVHRAIPPVRSLLSYADLAAPPGEAVEMSNFSFPSLGSSQVINLVD